MLNVTAGDTMVAGYGGNLTVGSGTLQGYGGVTLLAINATGMEGNITQMGGALGSAGMGAVVVHGGRNVDLSGVVSAMAGTVDVQAGVNGLAAMPNAYGGNLSAGGAISGYGGVTLAAHNATGTQGDISVTGSSVTAGGPTGSVKIYAGRNVNLSTSLNATSAMPGAIDIQAGVTGTMAPTVNAYGGNIDLNASTIAGYGGIGLIANNATGGQGVVTQTGGSLDAGMAGANISIRSGGNATLAGPIHAGGGIDIQAGMNGIAMPSGYGGDLSIGGSLTADAGTGVNLLAKGGSLAQGDLTQTGGTIYGATVVALNGNLTAGTGMLNVTAGDTMVAGYGGNLTVGSGTLQGYGGVTLLANAGSGFDGDLSLGGGVIGNAGTGGITLRGGRNVNFVGSLTSASGPVDIQAGMNGVAAMPSGYGGNLVLAAGSTISSGGLTGLFASGSLSSGGGVTQAGNLTSAGNVSIKGDRIVSINGSVQSTGGAVLVKSGHYLTPFYGGNLNFGVASNVAAYGGNLDAHAIGASGSAGSILQAGGNLYASANLTLAADGNVITHGTIVSPMNLDLFAGVDNFFAPASPMQTSAYGGNVIIGSASVIAGNHVGLFANHGDFPDGTTGHVTQSASAGTLTASGTSLNVFAAGDVNLLGTVVAGGAAPVTIRAGYDQPGSGPVTAFANMGIAINSLTSNGRDVNLEASGPIVANLVNAATINAMVNNSGSGGVAITNPGATTPIFMNLTDNSSANAAINYQQTGAPLTLTANHSFNAASGAGNVLIAAPLHDLSYSGANFLASSVVLGAGSNLTMAAPLSTGASLGLSAGSAIHVDSPVQAGSATLAAPTVNLVNGSVNTTGDALVFGSQINLGSGVQTVKLAGANVLLRGSTLGTGSLNLNGKVLTSGQIEFNLGTINGSYGGALVATSATSNITGFVSGDITLDNASHFEAGNDIILKLTGASSTLSLLNGSYLLADTASPTTSIYLDFSARTTPGLIVSGAGSGLFVGNLSTPATATNGLHLTFVAPAQSSSQVVNELVTSTEKASATESPTESNTPPPPTTGQTDPTQPPSSLIGTTGGNEGTFGSDTGGGTTSGGTTSGGTTSGGTTSGGTGGDGSGTSGGSGTGSTSGDQSSTESQSESKTTASNGKDEKKDEKEKDKDKDKKDQAKEEKKDEKPAQKKVAQCSS
ncbi:MAG: hypothetical protein HZB40_10030 [Rhodocyclales bacterium]|nr:hypothetical protein [Rhodocyclales bacterium]